MRRLLLAASAVAGVLAVSLPASAQTPAGENPSARIIRPEIAALLAQFPAGGPWLRAAITRAVVADPALTPDVIFAIGICTACQGQSIRQGLADAAEALARSGSEAARAAANAIRIALESTNFVALGGACLPPGLGIGRSASDPTGAAAVPVTNGANPATPTCVSPSRPGC